MLRISDILFRKSESQKLRNAPDQAKYFPIYIEQVKNQVCFGNDRTLTAWKQKIISKVRADPSCIPITVANICAKM